MSTVNIKWDFNMSDGTTQTTSAAIEDMILDGDDISSCVYSIPDFGGGTTSQTAPFEYINNRILNNTVFTATAGSLIGTVSSSIQDAFSSYAQSATIPIAYSSLTDQHWIQTASNATFLVTTANSPATDVFNAYLGRYSFITTGTTSGDSFILQIPELQTDGTVLDTTYNLTNGDTICVYGFQYDSETIAYNVLSKNIANETYATVVFADLSTSGSSATLNIPDIGVKFVYSYTGSGSYNVIVSPIGTSALSGVDLRRSTIWGGSATETYTIDGGTLPVAGTNIDSTVYNQSQDVSVVLVCVNGHTWEVVYWCSGGGTRFRTEAKRVFIP